MHGRQSHVKSVRLSPEADRILQPSPRVHNTFKRSLLRSLSNDRPQKQQTTSHTPSEIAAKEFKFVKAGTSLIPFRRLHLILAMKQHLSHSQSHSALNELYVERGVCRHFEAASAAKTSSSTTEAVAIAAVGSETEAGAKNRNKAIPAERRRIR